jgi:hypothetical protein
LSVFQFDVVVGRVRVAKALPLLLREKLISKRLISKRRELRQIKTSSFITRIVGLRESSTRRERKECSRRSFG